MGSKRKLPDTSQLRLLPDSEMGDSPREDSPCSPDRFLRGDPGAIFIGGVSLKKYLSDSGKDWVIRFRDLLFQQDIRPFLRPYKGTGRKPFHPMVILGLILYGMQQGRWSLRNLEDLARFDLCAWWICGGLQPDHSTLGEFIRLHSDLLSEEFFVALTADLVRRLKLPVGTVSGDGTVVEAVSSRLSMLKQEAARQQLDEAERAHGPDSSQARRRRDALETVAARNANRKSKGRGKFEAKVCPDEPEAVFQPRKDGVKRPGYKPSILADRHRFILGQHIEGAGEMACVSPMLDQYRGIFQRMPPRTLWDGNYFKLEMLELALSLDMDLLCNVESEGRGPFSKNHFFYDEKQDAYLCPAGRLLHYRKSGCSNNRPYREYQCKGCGGCDCRNRCTKSKSGRSLLRYQGEELKEAMVSVMSHPAAKKILRYRKAMVEPVFGDLACRQGLRRFHRRGLDKAHTEFSLHCMSYNLRKAIRLEQAGGVCFFLFYGEYHQKMGIRTATTAVFRIGNRIALLAWTMTIQS